MNDSCLIFGGGPCALETARRLVSAGLAVVVAAPDAPLDGPRQEFAALAAEGSIDVLTPARIDACRGFIGSFEVDLAIDGARHHRRVSHILVAEEYRRRPNFDDYPQLSPANLLPLSAGASKAQMFPEAPVMPQIVLLHGLKQESHPVIAEEVLRCALALQASEKARCCVLTTNLKVAGNGIEALYREAKAAGVLFFKFDRSRPEIHPLPTGKAEIVFRDDVSGNVYRLAPDLFLVDEAILPAENLENLATVLGLETDPAGFLQTENVHRLPVFTNRRGILALGPSRAILAAADMSAEAAAGALAVLGGPLPEPAARIEKARIDTGRCIRCLTCFRLCPHGAIQRNQRVEVSADACEGCGICAAECPRQAIRLGKNGFGLESPADAAGHDKPRTAEPLLIAFCCARSAGRAAEHAAELGLEIPSDLKTVTVPCAGAVSTADILSAFRLGARGVIVMACHAGNCHSEWGQRHALQRVEQLTRHFEQMGFDAERLAFQTLAANMETGFVDVIRRFDSKVRSMV